MLRKKLTQVVLTTGSFALALPETRVRGVEPLDLDGNRNVQLFGAITITTNE